MPRASVSVNGAPIAGLIGAEVISTSAFEADRFDLTFALGGDPAASLPFWSSTPAFLVSLSFGESDGPPVELVRGYADCLSVDAMKGRVRLEGRDMTSVFLETPVARMFPNQTASEIASVLASNHGLAASVTATTQPVGRYYQNDYTSMALESFSGHLSEWDLLSALAGYEGFDLFITGETLCFHPPQSGMPVRVIYPQEASSIVLRRTLRLVGAISVTVKSWNSHQGATVAETCTTQSDTLEPGSPAQQALSFVELRPNLTPAQAQNIAQRRLNELIPHRRCVEITMPGDTTLLARDHVAIAGTGTDFDQVYFIESIVRSIGREGFRQRVRANSAASVPLSSQAETA